MGKLTDQALDSFINELDKVSKENNEGEAQRYFDHALILKTTIQFLRNRNDLKLFSGFKKSEPVAFDSTTTVGIKQPIEDEPVALDLLRCESLASLDEDSRQRILAKNYSILFSMAPYSSSGESKNSPPITCDSPFHLGPAIPEVNSVWFRLYLYQLIKDGPFSIFLPKGYRLNHLPDSFKYYDKFMIITWGHDPIISTHFNLLLTLNDSLSHGPIMVQCYAENDEGGQLVNFAFNDTTHPLFYHPSVQKLHEKLCLKHFIGYITLLNPYQSTELNLNEKADFDEWTFLDLRYGIPLFDTELNHKILGQIKEASLGCYDNLNSMLELSRKLSLELVDFIQSHQNIDIVDKSFLNKQQVLNNVNITSNGGNSNSVNSHLFSDVNSYLITQYNNSKTIKKSNQANVVLYPTQCVLFENGEIKVESS